MRNPAGETLRGFKPITGGRRGLVGALANLLNWPIPWTARPPKGIENLYAELMFD